MGKISVVDIVLRLLGAVIGGFAVGAQRARTSHPAGIRTHILVALGSCVVMVTSCIMYEQTIAVFGTTHSDPARLGAQVINGIGFVPAPIAADDHKVYRVGTCEKWGNLRNVIWGAWDVCMHI